MTLRLSPSGPPVELSNTTSDLENTSDVTGATASDALDSLSSSITEFERGSYREQLLGGQNTNITLSDSGLFGEHRWSFFSTGGGLSRPTDANYEGAYAVTANATFLSALVIASSATLNVGNAWSPRRFTSLTLIGIPNIGDSALAEGVFRFGFGSAVTDSNFGDDGLFFEVDRTSSNEWQVVSRVGGVETARLSSSIDFSPHTLTSLNIEQDRAAERWSFAIDDVVIGTIATSLITDALCTLGLQVESGATDAQVASLDEIEFTYERAVLP